MTAREVVPTVDTDALLTGAQFADAFCIEVDDNDMDARHAAERMMARQPRWPRRCCRYAICWSPRSA